MSAERSFKGIFPKEKFIIAMIHLKQTKDVSTLERAIKETEEYLSNGVDAILVEDYFGSMNDVEAMLAWLQQNRPDVIYGVNVLGQYEKSYELAEKYGAKFMQYDSVAGHLPPESDAKFAEKIAPVFARKTVYVIGGVRFKYQPVRSGNSVEEDLRIGMTRCDAICVTGSRTGEPTDFGKIREFRDFIGEFPLIVGAGMNPANCQESLRIADGGIVGSWLKEGHEDVGDVNPEFVKQFMQAVQKVRDAPPRAACPAPRPESLVCPS